MKHIPAVTLAFALFFTSCATTNQTIVTPANVRTAVAMACSTAILFAPPDKQGEIRNHIWAIAAGAYSISGGKVPTPEEMRAMVVAFGGGDEWTLSLANSLESIWRLVYARIGGNTALGLEYLNAFFGGCADATRPPA